MLYIYSDQINQLIMSSMYNVNHHEKHVYTGGYPGTGSSPSPPGTPSNLTSQQLTQLKSQIEDLQQELESAKDENGRAAVKLLEVQPVTKFFVASFISAAKNFYPAFL